jgi:hypothetical protein
VTSGELPDRRQKLTLGQVTGCTEDDQRAGRRQARRVTINFVTLETRLTRPAPGSTRQFTHRSIIQLINPG